MTLIKNTAAAVLLALGLAAVVHADEALLRKNLLERFPKMGKIDEVSKTPIPGMFEVRVDNDLFYTDADGNYMFQGHLIDTKQQRNLTEERQDKLLAIDFAQLPLKDAFTIVRGNGKRKIAVFEDPNCGYCKRFERDMQKVDDVTVYMFLYPILGNDSALKARSLWCAADKGKAWIDFMVRDRPIALAPTSCDAAAVVRNVEFGRKYKISGTPTIIFADGSRVPGAIGRDEIEKNIARAK